MLTVGAEMRLGLEVTRVNTVLLWHQLHFGSGGTLVSLSWCRNVRHGFGVASLNLQVLQPLKYVFSIYLGTVKK